MSIILVVAYFWSGQGTSEANCCIFKQIQFIKTHVNLNVAVFADVNFNAQQLADAGWLGMLGLNLKIRKAGFGHYREFILQHAENL